jgi:predicted protein tyrosine phosphatase
MNIIGAFDRNTVSGLEPRSNSILISVTSQGKEHPSLNHGWFKVLKLNFDDVEGRNFDIGSSSNVMQELDAKLILDFVINNIDKDIFINCDAGISRSTGILVALEQIFNSRDVSHNYPFHNHFVKNKIKQVFYKTIWMK